LPLSGVDASRVILGLLRKLLLLGVAFGCAAGDFREVLEQARPPLRAYGVAEGLSTASVYSVLEDREGRLWIGTQEGVASFNGNAWKRHRLPTGTATSYVRALAETPDGSIWVGTEHAGLWRFLNGTWQGYSRANGLPSDRVNTLDVQAEPGGFALWVGTNAGVVRIRPTGLESVSQGLPSPWVWRFRTVRDPAGQSAFWACTMKGLARWEGGAWRPAGQADGVPEGEINDFMEIPRAGGGYELWVSAWGKGVFRWHEGRWTLHAHAQGFPSSHPVGLSQVQEAAGGYRIMVGTYDAGVASFDGSRWRVLDDQAGLGSIGVYVVKPSRANPARLWLGLRGGGLAHLDWAGWYSVLLPQSKTAMEVNALGEARNAQGNSVYWAGTNRGLMRWEGGRWQREGTETGLPDAYVTALWVTPPAQGPQQVWAATLHGLARREGNRWREVTDKALPKDNRIHCLLSTQGPGRERVLWAGTDLGLVRLGEQGSNFWGRTAELPLDQVYSLAETREASGQPSLWVGTRGSGVWRLREGRWQAYGKEKGLGHAGVYGLKEIQGRDGRRWLWAATNGGGAWRISLEAEGARWEAMGMARFPTLKSDVIQAIEQDGSGRVYLATREGVARLSFEGTGDPSQPSRVEVFTPGDGLPSAACMFGGLYRDSQGRIWVATQQGVAILDGSREAPPSPPARLLLDRLSSGGKELARKEGLKVGYREASLVFEYGLPSFHRSEDTRYASQMLGLETQPTPWTHVGSREFVALAPGQYTFRLWARDYLDRDIGPRDFAFSVQAPPWRRPWALALYLLFGAGLLWGLHWVRTRLLEQRNRDLKERVEAAVAELRAEREALQRLDEEKNEFIGIVAHDLRNPLNAVLLAAQQLDDPENTTRDAAHLGAIIEKATRQMTELITNLLEVNRIETGHLKQRPQWLDTRAILYELRGDFKERAQAKAIQFEVEVRDGATCFVDPMHLRNVLANLISNALKFTPIRAEGSRVWLRARAEGPLSVLEIEDQGPGFTEEDRQRAFGRFARLSARPTAGEASTGLGLAIVKSLTESLGGQVELESEAGRGTVFRLKLPARPPETN